MEIFDLTTPDEIDKLMKEARIVITHGGVGSILNALKYNKPVIAAARLSKYKEHTNDHQKQIIGEFVKDGYLIELDDFNKLDEVLKEASTFKPKKYKSNNKKFVNNNSVLDILFIYSNATSSSDSRQLYEFELSSLLLIFISLEYELCVKACFNNPGSAK